MIKVKCPNEKCKDGKIDPLSRGSRVMHGTHIHFPDCPTCSGSGYVVPMVGEGACRDCGRMLNEMKHKCRGTFRKRNKGNLFMRFRTMTPDEIEIACEANEVADVNHLVELLIKYPDAGYNLNDRPIKIIPHVE